MASSWAPIARSGISGFAMAMPATIIISRSSGGLRGVLSSRLASASRSRTALPTARRKRSVVHRGNDIAGEDAVSRLRRLGDGGRIPRPETGIAGELSSRLRRLDARLRALGDQRAFELRNCAE